MIINIYTFIGLLATVIYATTGIVLLALKYIQYAERKIQQADRRAKRAYQVLLEKRRAEEKEAYKKCLEEFYD